MTRSGKGQKSVLERGLSIFTPVHAGEGTTTLLMSLNVFLLLTSYYVIKPVREALILSEGGAEAKSYLLAAMAVVLFFLIQGYSTLVSRYERTRLISVVTGGFVTCLVVFWILSHLGVGYLGYFFFVWVGIFSVMVVAQFWSYANDVYNNESGKRLFPLVALGGNVGGFAGAGIADALLVYLNEFELLLVAAAMLVACIGITNMISRRIWGRSGMQQQQETLSRKLRQTRGTDSSKEDLGFGLLRQHRYVALIAGVVLMLNLVNTPGEYILGKLVEERGQQEVEQAAAQAAAAGTPLSFENRELGSPQDEQARLDYQRSWIGSFYARFFLIVNLLGMFLQLVVVSRLVRWWGVRAGLLWLPLVALGTNALIFFIPFLAVARVGKTLENASDYSINKTVLQMLFLPTSTDIKYKAKQVVDSFFQRFGDVASAVVVLVGTQVFVFGTSGFAMANVVFVLLWLGLIAGIAREHRAIEAGNRPRISEDA